MYQEAVFRRYQEKNSKVKLIGRIIEPIKLNHESYGEKFFSTVIETKRLSGTWDKIPVIIPERAFSIGRFDIDEIVVIEGDCRTRNEEIDGKSHLRVYVFYLF